MISSGPALPNGTLGTAYSTTLAAAGETPPYTWSISTGALPAGLTLNGSTGAITGTPQAAGSFQLHRAGERRGIRHSHGAVVP